MVRFCVQQNLKWFLIENWISFKTYTRCFCGCMKYKTKPVLRASIYNWVLNLNYESSAIHPRFCLSVFARLDNFILVCACITIWYLSIVEKRRLRNTVGWLEHYLWVTLNNCWCWKFLFLLLIATQWNSRQMNNDGMHKYFLHSTPWSRTISQLIY